MLRPDPLFPFVRMAATALLRSSGARASIATAEGSEQVTRMTNAKTHRIMFNLPSRRVISDWSHSLMRSINYLVTIYSQDRI